jgi:hypothetical protein
VIKKIIKFIKENPITENQYYDNIDGIIPIFAICNENDNKIVKHIDVDNKHNYYFDKNFLYVQNKKTENFKEIKIK